MIQVGSPIQRHEYGVTGLTWWCPLSLVLLYFLHLWGQSLQGQFWVTFPCISFHVWLSLKIKLSFWNSYNSIQFFIQLKFAIFKQGMRAASRTAERVGGVSVNKADFKKFLAALDAECMLAFEQCWLVDRIKALVACKYLLHFSKTTL